MTEQEMAQAIYKKIRETGRLKEFDSASKEGKEQIAMNIYNQIKGAGKLPPKSTEQLAGKEASFIGTAAIIAAIMAAGGAGIGIGSYGHSVRTGMDSKKINERLDNQNEINKAILAETSQQRSIGRIEGTGIGILAITPLLVSLALKKRKEEAAKEEVLQETAPAPTKMEVSIPKPQVEDFFEEYTSVDPVEEAQVPDLTEDEGNELGLKEASFWDGLRMDIGNWAVGDKLTEQEHERRALENENAHLKNSLNTREGHDFVQSVVYLAAAAAVVTGGYHYLERFLKNREQAKKDKESLRGGEYAGL